MSNKQWVLEPGLWVDTCTAVAPTGSEAQEQEGPDILSSALCEFYLVESGRRDVEVRSGIRTSGGDGRIRDAKMSLASFAWSQSASEAQLDYRKPHVGHSWLR